MEDKYKAYVAMVAIICLVSYGIYALHVGFDGLLSSTIVGAIATIVGAILGVVIGAKKTSNAVPKS